MRLFTLAYGIPSVSLLIFNIVTTIPWALAVWWTWRRPPPVTWILAFALGFRLLAAGLPYLFSDDVYRYRWEGRIQAGSGANPYLSRPLDLVGGRPGDERIPGRGVASVYGPALLLIERLWYPVAGEEIRLWKVPAMVGDALAILMLIAWLRARGEPLARVVFYAWCPLPVVEFWGQGHHDAWIVAAIAAILWAHAAGRWRILAALFGLAVQTKFFPAMLGPLLAGREFDRWRMLAAGLAGSLALYLPYWQGITLDRIRYTTGFLSGWRNNDSLHGLLLALTGGDPHAAKRVALGLLALLTGWLWARRAQWPFEDQALAALGGLLLISANVHPWYVTWLLPFAVARPRAWVMVAAGAAPLFHDGLWSWHLLGVWDPVRPTRWLVYGGVLAALVISGLAQRRERSRMV
jgi:hypothetical protein